MDFHFFSWSSGGGWKGGPDRKGGHPIPRFDMYVLLDRSTLRQHSALWGEMTRQRAGQFVDRHGWPLEIDTARREIDAFDDGLARYALVRGGGRLLASARLRPGVASMTEAVFSDFRNLLDARLTRGIEVTRFCVAPGLDPLTRAWAVSELLLGLCRTCQGEKVGHLFGVVFPSVRRALRRLGWDARILGRGEDRSGELLLGEWRADAFAAWSIQSTLEAQFAGQGMDVESARARIERSAA